MDTSAKQQLRQFMNGFIRRNHEQPEFYQAVYEVAKSKILKIIGAVEFMSMLKNIKPNSMKKSAPGGYHAIWRFPAPRKMKSVKIMPKH